MRIQRKDAKTQRRAGVCLSLAHVSGASDTEKLFQRFLPEGGKPWKRFACHLVASFAVFLTTVCSKAQGTLTLNAGDIYTYQFSTLPLQGTWSIHDPPGIPIGRVDGLFTFQLGSSVLIEMFEDSTASPPIASQALSYLPGFPAPPGPWFWRPDAWQDLQGTLRVSALSGSITMRSLDVTVRRDDTGMLNSYRSSALPVPEPSSFLLLGFFGLLCAIGKVRHAAMFWLNK